MKRYRLTIQYDGTDFCGWQRQKNGISVQETLEKAIEPIVIGAFNLVASGRTDCGVHARAQTAHLDAETRVPAVKMAAAINARLPESVSVISVSEAENSFHARYGAKRKTYVYTAYISSVRLPLLERTAVRLDKMPVISIMREAARLIEGEHDFKCFLASNSSVKSTVRTVYSVGIEEDNGVLRFKVCGNGFLYNMVRIIVGTLLEIGYGKKNIEDLKHALERGDRKLAGKTAVAKGLTLYSVEYGI